MSEREIFTAALTREVPAERAAFLDEACAGDASLRARVESLLAEYQQLGSFMDVPSPAVTLVAPPQERPGTQIGPYKLLQQIGEGGMGVVFLAEQTHPVRRHVALKVIKAGMDTRQVVARFESERQALALMDHPNIAKVFDAGATETGRPYFVMELVKGVPITQYCDAQHLTPRDRLALFVQVCQAVQHAHQKGIIHRDLKPSNVLIALYDGKPVPKVIDFGVAKATGGRLTEHTVFTGFGAVVGTPEYMSPEQAELNQLDVDTRSDVYSLGVILYELLTGSTPVERGRFKAAALMEMLRVVREEEAPRPSTRLSTTNELASIAACRGLEPKKLGGVIRGELDWIVMRALEKDRDRRYETANGFAADVQRYLADEPVQACPPSARYRFRKFVRRNTRVLSTVALLGVMLLAAVGTVAGSLGWVSRDRAARRTVVEQAAARALQGADELQKQRRWQEALVAVERAQAVLVGSEGAAAVRQRVVDQLADLRLIQRLEEFRTQRAEILDNESQAESYPQVFKDIGIDVQALAPPDAAALILRRPGTAVQVAAALDDWAQVLRNCGLRDKTLDPAAWKRLLEVASLADPDPWRAQLRRLTSREDLAALRKLADASDMAALPLQNLQLMSSALAIGGDAPACIAWLRKSHRQHPDDALIAFELAFHLSNLPAPEWAEALRFAEAALSARPSPGMYHFVGVALGGSGRQQEATEAYRKAIELKPDYPFGHNGLGNALRDLGRLDEAIVAYRRVVELTPNDGGAYSSLGVALSETPHLDEAVAAHRKAISLKPNSGWAHVHLGHALARSGQHEAAIAAARKAVEFRPGLAEAHDVLGFALSQDGQLTAALTAFAKALELRPDFAPAYTNLGHTLRKAGRLDEAIVAYRKAVELKPDSGTSYTNLGIALSETPRLDEAVVAHRKALELKPKSAWVRIHLAYSLSRSGQHEAAVAAAREAVELQPGLADAYICLGFANEHAARLDEAIALYRLAIGMDPTNVKLRPFLDYALRQQALPSYREAVELDPKNPKLHFRLGEALRRQGTVDEAIVSYRQAVELDPKYALAYHELGMLLKGKGKIEEAVVCCRKAVELNPKDQRVNNNAAWLLAAGPDPKFHDPKSAVEMAKNAVEQMPANAGNWNTLGTAHYRAGQWRDAAEALKKSDELYKGDMAGFNAIFLAMAHWRMGERDESSRCYDRAVAWMEKNRPADEELRRFRAEATELLGIGAKEK